MFELDQEARAYGTTAIENRFLMDYLPSAKGEYVKVYLWAQYALANKGPEYSLQDMAADLFLTVPEVEAALRYWERRGLVSRMSDEPPRYRLYSPMQRQSASQPAAEVDMAYVSFAETVYAVFGDRRKVRPAEISLAWEWVQDIGLSPEAVLMLVHHCIAQRGISFSFSAAEKMAVAMKEAGVKSAEDAETFLEHDQAVHEGVRKVLSRMGKRRAPTEDEIALYEKWIGPWGFEPKAVLDSCKEMTSGDPSFKYLDKILERLHGKSEARTSKQLTAQLEQEEEEKNLAKELFREMGMSLEAPAAIREYRELRKIQPHEVLLHAARVCAKRGHNLEDLQDLAQMWKDKGLDSEEAVRAYTRRLAELNRKVKEVYEACGHSGRPTRKDRQLYEKWESYGYDQELILAAAEQARNSEGNKLKYLEKVIDTWHDAGVTDISQTQTKKQMESRRKMKTVSAQQYTQREYTEEELLAISDDLIEEARGLYA